MKTCYNCETNRRTYIKDCLGCAVRLVKSARPSRQRQEGMLQMIERYGVFTRQQVIEGLKNDGSVSANS